MNQRTDFGWWLNSVDYPYAGSWSSAAFRGGLFTGVVQANPNCGCSRPRSGARRRTESSASTIRSTPIVYRVARPHARPTTGYILWEWTHELDLRSSRHSNVEPVYTTPGWRNYIVDLPTLGTARGSEPWAGTKRSFKIDPVRGQRAGGRHRPDRLGPSRRQSARALPHHDVVGTGPVDIYLDNDNSATSDPNQTLGLVASNVGGTSYSLNAGALAPGDYYVAIRRTGTDRRLLVLAGLLSRQRAGDDHGDVAVGGGEHGRFRDRAPQ